VSRRGRSSNWIAAAVGDVSGRSGNGWDGEGGGGGGGVHVKDSVLGDGTELGSCIQLEGERAGEHHSAEENEGEERVFHRFKTGAKDVLADRWRKECMEKSEERPACAVGDEVASALPPDCGPFMGSGGGATRELPCFAGWTASIPACARPKVRGLCPFFPSPPPADVASLPVSIYVRTSGGGLLCLPPPRASVCPPEHSTFEKARQSGQRANTARGRRRQVGTAPARDRPLLRAYVCICLPAGTERGMERRGAFFLQVRTPAGTECAHLRID